MRWCLGFLALIGFVAYAYGITQVSPQYKTEEDINAEFKYFSDNCQDRQHTIYLSTPTFGDLRDGELVIVASNTFNMAVYRAGQELYRINVSCITVKR